MRFISEKIFHHITFYVIAIYALHLCWSPYANAFSVYVIAGFVVLQSLFSTRKDFSFLRSVDVYLFSAPVLISLVGLLYAEEPVFREFVVVVPIFAFALGMKAFQSFSQEQFKRILFTFITSTALCAVFNFVYYLSTKTPESDIREMAVTMSHIRFSLLCNIAIFSAFYYIFWTPWAKHPLIVKLGLLVNVIVLLSYLIIQQSLSGLGTFSIFLIFGVFQFFLKHKGVRNARLFGGSILTVIVIAFAIVVHEARFFIHPNDADAVLPVATVNGNAYLHDVQHHGLENGNFVMRNVCPPELSEEWSKLSKVSIGGNDAHHQPLYFTLIRYMASKGLTKDSLGLTQLSAEDIANVENGITNYRFSSQFTPIKKIYTFFWEIHAAINGRNPSGLSAAQRFVFQSVTMGMIKEHFWFGIGTTRIESALIPYYEKTDTGLDRAFWLGPHNQFVTFFAMFGFVGFSLIIGSLVILMIRQQAFHCYFKSLYFITILLSMLFEDTISTQIGVVLYGYFGALFLFGTQDSYRFDGKA